MRLTSILVLAAAIILGIVAVTGVRAMLQNSQRSAGADTETAIVTSTVVVARTPLEFGTELQPELLKEIPWASQERPEGSFAKISDIVSGERRVALRSIAPGELVLQDRISGFGGRATLSQIIEPGMRAITLRVNDVSGTGGFVLPGDRVDVLATLQPTNERIDTITNIILEDVRVLAIDQVADDSQEGAIVAKAATLEVAPDDAQRIALASSIGQLSLALRNITTAALEDEGEIDTFTARTIGFRDLGPQSVEAPKAAARPRATVRRAPSPVKSSPYTTMKVIRGVESSNVEVLKDETKNVIGSVDPEQLLGAPRPITASPPPAQ